MTQSRSAEPDLMCVRTVPAGLKCGGHPCVEDADGVGVLRERREGGRKQGCGPAQRQEAGDPVLKTLSNLTQENPKRILHLEEQRAEKKG